MTLPAQLPMTLGGAGSLPASTALSFPSGPMLPVSANRLLDGIDEHLFATNTNGVVPMQFYLKGPFAPCAPGIPGQDGIVIQSVDGMAPNFKHKDLQAALQDGVTWTDTVFDPAEVTFTGEIHAATAQGLTAVKDAWMGAWNPRQQLMLEHISLDGGYWYAKARLANTWTGAIKQDRRFLYQPITHKCRIDDAFWCGPDSTDSFGPSYETFGEYFAGETGNLSNHWTVTYSSGHTGTVQLANGVGAYWSDSGNSDQSAEVIYNTQTDTDFQIINIQLGGAWEGLALGGFATNQIWGRVDGSGNAVMCQIGNNGVYVYRINSGTRKLMWFRPLLIPPLPNETWTFILGADLSNPRSYSVIRSGWHISILGLFTIGFGGEVLRFAEAGAGSVVGPSARGVGFGMGTATGDIGGGGPIGTPMAVPIPIAAFSAADNTGTTETGFVQLSNIGTEDGWPTYTLTGPGTFGIADGPNSSTMVNIGPVAAGQTLQVTTLPRLRSVVDVNSPTKNVYPLMSGRFVNPVPGVALPSQAQPVQIPVSVTGGSATTKIVASLTPQRIHPA